MSASTGNVARDRRSEHAHPSYWPNLPLKGGVIAYQGSIMCKTLSTGYVRPGVTATGLLTLGIYTYRRKDLRGPIKDSTGLADGVLSIQEIEMGVFPVKNSTIVNDIITLLDVGEDCFVIDDQTVGLTNDGAAGGGATRSRAGKIYDVSSDGVWVWFDGQ